MGDKFEIVFCSGDRDAESLKGYYEEQKSKGGCLAIMGRCAAIRRWHHVEREQINILLLLHISIIYTYIYIHVIIYIIYIHTHTCPMINTLSIFQ